MPGYAELRREFFDMEGIARSFFCLDKWKLVILRRFTATKSDVF